ncbi:MAG: hypothetical protein FJ297_14580 [Planctomycetes bacterium]|nr:hypothetical protein [Planctomycetota bacterium]
MTGSPANVRSIESLREFRAALAVFQRRAEEAVTTLSLELRKAIDWIEQDRARYWPNEVKRASDRLVEARSNLERCRTTTRPEDRPSCMVEQKALERAKARLRYCEEKVRTVRHWRIALLHEAREFEGRLATTRDQAETDVPRSLAALERIVESLERYLAIPELSDTAREPPPAPRAAATDPAEAARADAPRGMGTRPEATGKE